MIAQASPYVVFTRDDTSSRPTYHPVEALQTPTEATDEPQPDCPQVGVETPSEPSRRLRLTDSVLSALYADFEEHGAWAIERMRLEEPTQYVKLIVSLMPRALVTQFEQHRLGEAATIAPEQLMELQKGKVMQQAVETTYTNQPPAIHHR